MNDHISASNNDRTHSNVANARVTSDVNESGPNSVFCLVFAGFQLYAVVTYLNSKKFRILLTTF